MGVKLVLRVLHKQASRGLWCGAGIWGNYLGLDWVWFNILPNTLYVMSGTGCYGWNDQSISVKAQKEVRVLRYRLQSRQVHLTVVQCNTYAVDKKKQNTHTLTWVDLIHPTSTWTYWATLRRHSCLLRAATSASSPVSPIPRRSFLTIPLQFVLGRPGHLLKPGTSQYSAWNTKIYTSEMGPVWQTPIQRTVKTARLSVLMTVHNFSTQFLHRTVLIISPLTSRQPAGAVYGKYLMRIV